MVIMSVNGLIICDCANEHNDAPGIVSSKNRAGNGCHETDATESCFVWCVCAHCLGSNGRADSVRCWVFTRCVWCLCLPKLEDVCPVCHKHRENKC